MFFLTTAKLAPQDIECQPKTLAKLASRGQLEHVGRGVYRVPLLPGGEMAPYMAATP